MKVKIRIANKSKRVGTKCIDPFSFSEKYYIAGRGSAEFCHCPYDK